MTRLPQPGKDAGQWGDILNDYLSQSHNTDGTLKDNVVGASQLQDNAVTDATIAPGAITKATVGLANVDNTSDSAKPVSTVQQAALDLKADTTALTGKLNTSDLDAQTAAKITTDGTATQAALLSTIGTEITAWDLAPADERPNPFPGAYMSHSKGGVVGTNGRVPVAFRLDDWQDNIISTGFIDKMKTRGLFGSIVLVTELGANNWNRVVTWETLRTWNQQNGMEVWSHGTNHVTPWDPDPETYRDNLVREIITSKETIEAQGIRCMGWAMPGVAEHDGTPGYETYLSREGHWNTTAGKLLTATYALVETDMTGEYRVLPSNQRYGLGHITITDGIGLQTAKNYLDEAIRLGYGVEFMLHVGNIGSGSNMNMAAIESFLDYVVAQREAGLIEVVQPSTLPYCDPDRSRRRNLLRNNDFTKPVSPSFVGMGNWTGVDGVNRQVVDVANGPGGSAAKVLRVSASGFAGQHANNAIGTGIAGQVFLLDFWARSTGANSSVRFYAQAANVADFNFQNANLAVTSEWQRFRFPFAPPPTLDVINIGFGYGYYATAAVEFADINCYVA